MQTVEEEAQALVDKFGRECATYPTFQALCRVIEENRAMKAAIAEVHQAFDNLDYCKSDLRSMLTPFLPAPKVDPLHDALEEALARTGEDLTEHVERLRAALASRNLEIREISNADR